MVDNQSQLVDINANNRIKQGVVNRSGAVTSNGVQISNGATSSLGSSDASNQMPNAIYIQPKVPAGLNAAETETFNQSYPPLPSTDSRTRSAPYA
jgi:hypothetical protein